MTYGMDAPVDQSETALSYLLHLAEISNILGVTMCRG
jgi:hypothetical protein